MPLGIALAVLSAGLVAAQAGTPSLQRAEALVVRGRELAETAVSRQDRAGINAAKKQFEDAEKLLRTDLKANAACERCYELITAVTYYRVSMRAGKDYGDVIEEAARGLARYPANATLLFFKGYASYGQKDYTTAAKALGQYLASPRAADDQTHEARAMLDESRRHFLTEWYSQRDFYVSSESRITRVNLQTYKPETLFQVTPQYELSLGQQAFAALQGTAPVMQAPDVEGYLQRLVNRLSGATPGPGFAYRVSIFDAPEVNAVTAPGHIIFYTGLLRFVENESQLAGVVAHELAHNYGHHAARQVIKAYHAQSIAAAAVKTVNPQTQTSQLLTTIAAGLGVGLFMNAYSRFEEAEADRYGAHLLFNAGYNPTGMTSFLLKMYRQQPRQPIKFLSTHPPLPDRVDKLAEYLEAFALDQELAVDSEAFQQIVAARFGNVTSAAPAAGMALMPPMPGASRGLTGTFGPGGDIEVTFSEAGGEVIGRVSKPPASGAAPGGFVIFRGTSRGDRVEGTWMTLPSPLCSAVTPRGHSAQVTRSGGALTIIVNEAELDTRACVWGETLRSNTYTWPATR